MLLLQQHRHGPTLDELLQNDPSICVEELPSDEAWCGTPDPSMYAAGTNHLTRDQLDAEVSKGNVVTLRQLKAHLAGASAEELDVRIRTCMSARMHATKLWLIGMQLHVTAYALTTCLYTHMEILAHM